MKLMNGKKYLHNTPDSHSETEFENVKKRLELLYKDRYDLQINEDDEVFVVNLTLELVMHTKPTVVDAPVNVQLEYA